jgi:ribosomal protein S26
MYQGSPTGYNATPPGIQIIGAPSSAGSAGPVINAQITSNTFTNIQPLVNPNPINAPILATAQGTSTIQNLLIANNTMSQYATVTFGCSLCCGICVAGPAGSMAEVGITGNNMTGTAYSGVYVDGVTNFDILSNTISNGYGLGIYSGTSNAGVLLISGNAITNCGLAPPNSKAVTYLGLSTQAAVDVQAAAGITSAAIQNNTYGTASEGNNLKYDIYCALSKSISTVNGNQNAALLSNYGPL